MRMEGFQGAVLSVKLKYLEEWTEKRRHNAQLYNDHFKDVKGVITPRTIPGVKHVYHLYVIRVKNREKLQQYLSEKGISTGFHYKYPLHLQQAYKHLGYKTGDFPATERVMSEIISLPMYPELTPAQIEYVADAVIQFTKKH